MILVFSFNSFKNRSWKKIFGVFFGESSSIAMLVARVLSSFRA